MQLSALCFRVHKNASMGFESESLARLIYGQEMNGYKSTEGSPCFPEAEADPAPVPAPPCPTTQSSS